ncbi:capsule assembly Wzi family protein [Geomesophilobacter sediminis]|uniref:Capsule assembly Wzi family protein n=1 Tax=Geomesophilobacter sediminis TaxID=2798584 RepID=A0A8J7JFX5_9BACT|nr:capsule assembly Wzi family protein [Geomesophilobacter sediminis]MBJ6723180.1 capsule assembly Wzi family protein [Geomesophilobacter sediminis]
MRLFRLLFALLVAGLAFPGLASALSSTNIPLDSPIYLYLEKLSGFGLIRSDFKGIRPFSKAEAARLVDEAQERMSHGDYPPFAADLVARLKELLPREEKLRREPGSAPSFEITPVANARVRYVYVDGVPRNYTRPVNDPGNDGVFGIGSGLRPPNPYPTPVQQRGTEGTPLFENNQGVVYDRGNNLDLRGTAEAYVGTAASLLVEPLLLWSERSDASLRINKGYLKLGGGGLELEVGRDENWLGLGYRGNVTLTNNAKNFDLVKLSSPEPVRTKYLWDLKYDFIFSQFEKTTTLVGGVPVERQPLFMAGKLSMKPTENFEFGINLGRQVGGPGINNSTLETLRGLIGGFNNDNSNSLAGFELRFRFPWLRDSELYGEYSGEDAAAFWPIVESYVAGIFVPRLTENGRDDLRFEYFLGNQILYTHGIYQEGYLRHGMPIGDSQGGATQDFFLRYSHWFSVRNNLALEGIRTSRGDIGKLPQNAQGIYDPNGTPQAIERVVAVRAFWSFPVHGEWNALLGYGREWIDNFDLKPGEHRDNQIVRAELTYRY